MTLLRLLPLLLLPGLTLAGVAAAEPAAAEPAAVTPLDRRTSVTIVDTRPADRSGRQRLGLLADGGDLSSGPPVVERVRSSVRRAAASSGLLVDEHAEVELLALRVEDLWCVDSTCDVALVLEDLVASLDLARIEAQVPLAELDLRLAELLAPALGPAPAVPLTPPEAQGSVRFGWVDATDGTRYAGPIATGPTEVCVGGRAEVAVPLDEVAGVRVVHLPLVGDGESLAVHPLSESDWVGGQIVQADALSTVLATADGFVSVDRPPSAFVRFDPRVQPTCLVLAAASSPAPAPVEGPPPPEGFTIVDRTGTSIRSSKLVTDSWYAIPSKYLGDRRWHRRRLSWSAFAQAVDDPFVSQSLAEYLELCRVRKNMNTGIGAAGWGITAGSAIALIPITIGQSTDERYAIGGAMAAAGIGTGITMGLVAAVQRIKWGKRADRPERYVDLGEWLRLEDLEAILER